MHTLVLESAQLNQKLKLKKSMFYSRFSPTGLVDKKPNAMQSTKIARIEMACNIPGSIPSVFGALRGAKIVMSLITTLLKTNTQKIVSTSKA
jgi:hypothetical protein